MCLQGKGARGPLLEESLRVPLTLTLQLSVGKAPVLLRDAEAQSGQGPSRGPELSEFAWPAQHQVYKVKTIPAPQR